MDYWSIGATLHHSNTPRSRNEFCRHVYIIGKAPYLGQQRPEAAARPTHASVEYLRTHAGLRQDCSSQAVPHAAPRHNVLVSDRSQPPMAVDLALSESAGSGSLDRLVGAISRPSGW
jgi:hypothetical protein